MFNYVLFFSPWLFSVVSFYCGSKMLFLRGQTYSLDSPLTPLIPFVIFMSCLLLRDLF